MSCEDIFKKAEMEGAITKQCIDSNQIPEVNDNKENIECVVKSENYGTNDKDESQDVRDQSNAKPHKCPLCDYAANQKEHIRRHVFFAHLKLKQYQHYKCNCTAGQNVHIDFDNFKLEQFRCFKCGYSASEKESLKTHIDSVHFKWKPHQCRLCDYSAIRKGHLLMHMHSAHSYMKQFQCKQCGYQASRKGHLKIHEYFVHSK